jgi:NAD(P)-dependent dehydrogenase (short-subunit alcohol dehydrogenase family)/predicted MFS family arabinose efflux permease
MRLAFALLGAVQITLIGTITVITVALPAIQRDLRIDDAQLVLVTSAYGLSFGGLLLLGGRLSDLFDRRRVFITGMAVFGLASAAAGLAPRLDVLLIARFAEGIGAALAAPAAMALLGTVFPDPGRRRSAMAVWGVLSSAGATAGTVLSGAAIAWVSWRMVFIAPVAVSAVAIIAARRIFPAEPAEPAGPAELAAVRGLMGRAGRIDWLGAALATGGLAALIYGVQRSGWTAAVGVALLALFGVAERRSPAPLMPPAFLRARVLPLLAVTLCAGAMATAFFLLSLYLQQVRGLTALQTSAAFLLPVPAIAVAGPLAGRLVHRLPIRRVLALGTGTAAVGLLLLSFLGNGGSGSGNGGGLGTSYAGLLVFPLGAGLTFSAATLAATRDVPDEQAGLAGGMLNTAMEIGPPLGLAVLTSLAATYSDHSHHHDPAIGYAFALRIAAAALLATALVAASIRRADNTLGETEMTARFTGKVALITGGGTGIGRAAALAFAREGATVVVAGRNAGPLERTVQLVEDEGGRASAVTADVSSSADVARLVETTVQRHGDLDIAFNNAGTIEAGPLADMDEAAWDRQVAVNLTGVFLSMKHEIAHMRGNGGGVIINTASNLGAHMRVPHLGGYAASKAAVSALTRAAALEYIGEGIRINAISPGPMDTPMSLRPGETEADRAERIKAVLPIGRVGTMDEAASAVLWLASPESGFTVGHDLVLDGGATA